jgi:hypothetical protein
MGQWSRTPSAELIAIYQRAAADHGAATEHGDARSANREHDVVASIYSELRHRGTDAQLLLLRLIHDPDMSVCGWAAAHALEFAPQLAEARLREIADTKGPAGFAARMVIEQWQAGQLAFPDLD